MRLGLIAVSERCPSRTLESWCIKPFEIQTRFETELEFFEKFVIFWPLFKADKGWTINARDNFMCVLWLRTVHAVGLKCPFMYRTSCILSYTVICPILTHFREFLGGYDEHESNASIFGTPLYCNNSKTLVRVRSSNLVRFLSWQNRTMNIKYRRH